LISPGTEGVWGVEGISYDPECECVSLQQTFQTGVDRSDTDRHVGILGGIFLCYFPNISESHRLKFIMYLSKGAKVAWFQTIAGALLQTATHISIYWPY
jgi:hypothetical protein